MELKRRKKLVSKILELAYRAHEEEKKITHDEHTLLLSVRWIGYVEFETLELLYAIVEDEYLRRKGNKEHFVADR